jgi:hypothetical protein
VITLFLISHYLTILVYSFSYTSILIFPLILSSTIHNPDFNYGEFAIIRSQAGLNSYKISVKEWVNKIPKEDLLIMILVHQQITKLI